MNCQIRILRRTTHSYCTTTSKTQAIPIKIPPERKLKAMNSKQTSAISVGAFAATALSIVLYKSFAGAKRKCPSSPEAEEPSSSKRLKEDTLVDDDNSVQTTLSQTSKQTDVSRSCEGNHDNVKLETIQEARDQKARPVQAKSPKMARLRVLLEENRDDVAAVVRPNIETKPCLPIADNTAQISDDVASVASRDSYNVKAVSTTVNVRKPTTTNVITAKAPSNSPRRPVVAGAPIIAKARSNSPMRPVVAGTPVRPVVAGVAMKRPVVATVTKPTVQLDQENVLPRVRNPRTPTRSAFSPNNALSDATNSHAFVTSRSRTKQQKQKVIKVRDSLLPTEIRQKKQKSGRKAAKTTPTARRVRDSLLPMNIRQRIAQQEEQEREEEQEQQTVFSVAASTTTSPRRKVRDSLLPMDIRQRMALHEEEEENDEEQETVGSVASVSSSSCRRVRDSLLPQDIRQRIAQTQQRKDGEQHNNRAAVVAYPTQHVQQRPVIAVSSNPLTSPSTKPSTRTSKNLSRRRTPKKLTPTRVNIFDRKNMYQ